MAGVICCVSGTYACCACTFVYVSAPGEERKWREQCVARGLRTDPGMTVCLGSSLIERKF
jgi:hypothetical protein